MKKIRQEANQYAGGYSLHLYCDHINEQHDVLEFPHEFGGETFTESARYARKRGWVIHRKTRTATCPKCSTLTGRKEGEA
jgi:hypothetical protein